MNLEYAYDAVSNITSPKNSGSLTSSGKRAVVWYILTATTTFTD